MGELSKKSGDIGEALAQRLTAAVGWNLSIDNTSIPCTKSAHKNAAGNKRTSHGEDRIFIYDSPFHDEVTTIVHISVKHSLSKVHAVSTLRTKFKEHYIELQQTIECAIASATMQNLIESRGARREIRHIGLLLWRYNEIGDRSISHDLAPVELPPGGRYPIYLVDNDVQEFLHAVTQYTAKKKGVFNFIYPEIGSNLETKDPRKGTILPVELMVANVLPMLQQKKSSMVLYLFANEPFSVESYRKLIQYGLMIGHDLIKTIRIGMPDYSAATHNVDAQVARSSFPNREETVYPFRFSSGAVSLLES